MSEDLDLVVIGSGPGGYVAALRATQLGMRTCVVEKDPQFGGTCLHRGCIPTKVMLHVAEQFAAIGRAGEMGVVIEGGARFDGAKSKAYRDAVVQKNARGIEYLFRKNGVQVVHGRARVGGPGMVEASGDQGIVELRAHWILIATGSIPVDLPHLRADGKRIVNSDQILDLEQVPSRLVVVGGGAVGVEFGSIFSSLGAKVMVVEMLDRLLPGEDRELSEELERCFRRRRIEVRTETQIEGVAESSDGLRVTLQGSSEPEACDLLLLAAGRKPVIEDLGLEDSGVEVQGGRIATNPWMQTSAEEIYAIGDVVKGPQLAHLASAEGILAVEHMAGVAERAINYDHIPSCTYCDPEVASVGLSEVEAEARGFNVEVGKFPFSASGKAAILGKPEGFVKVVRDSRYDELLGVHVIGAHATDLIAEACVALQIESTTEELFRTVHAHPTLSEAMAEAAQAALGRPLHA